LTIEKNVQSKEPRWAILDRRTQPMTNNTALFDAALATIADSNGAWITSPATGAYVAQANAAVAVATEIDAAIPTVIGGATISQRNLLVAITKSVMEGRSPTNTSPTVYAAIAAAIGGMFGEYKTRLLNNDVGGGGSGTLVNLSNVLFVDQGTSVALADQDGNIESPFATLVAGIAAATADDSIFLTPSSYFIEGLITVDKLLDLVGFGGSASTAGITLTAGVTIITTDLSCIGVLTVPATSFAYLTHGAVTGGITGDGSINLNKMTVTGSVVASEVIANDSTIVGNITLSGTIARFNNTDLAGGTVITFSGAAGTVTMDGYTYHKWLLIPGTIVNGTINVVNSLERAIVTVVFPIIGDGELTYIDVSMIGTELEGILANTPIAYNPVTDLVPADIGGGLTVPSARVSADNTVRLTVVGPLDVGQSSDFIITRLASN
jgi:hypothetical protein